MCELQDMRLSDEVPLPSFTDEKWTPLQKAPTRLIKVEPQSGPVGTMVTVRLDSTLLGPFIPRLVFQDLVMETKCMQSQGQTRLTASVPDHPSPATVPLYLYLFMDDGVVIVWHLTDFIVTDSGKRVNFEPFYQFPLLDRYEQRSRSISDPYDTIGFTNLLAFNDQDRLLGPIHLLGDLNTMTENWTPEEEYNGRRLVRFTCTRTSSTFQLDFYATMMMPQPCEGPILSCIYWAEHNEWYITSVDCLLLLEYVMQVRFTVDEKNRVRRNLEGFHPITISKAKPDSAAFFKRIMAYSNPKPRNIEKDLKVFAWSSLYSALLKITRKYACHKSQRRASAPSRHLHL